MMKKKSHALLADNVMTPSCGNIFIDMGFEPAEAHVMLMRSMLMNRIEHHLNAQPWTQAEAAKRLGIDQPRVSRLKKGVMKEFSLDMLLTFATKLGMEPELRLAA
jgi:predicted XRE-type DNA-binding protein